MEVTFDASAVVEAGRLVGAEGLVFVKAGCAAGRDVVDVKMTDTTSARCAGRCMVKMPTPGFW